jgi:hypothetical protein
VGRDAAAGSGPDHDDVVCFGTCFDLRHNQPLCLNSYSMPDGQERRNEANYDDTHFGCTSGKKVRCGRPGFWGYPLGLIAVRVGRPMVWKAPSMI